MTVLNVECKCPLNVDVFNLTNTRFPNPHRIYDSPVTPSRSPLWRPHCYDNHRLLPLPDSNLAIFSAATRIQCPLFPRTRTPLSSHRVTLTSDISNPAIWQNGIIQGAEEEAVGKREAEAEAEAEEVGPTELKGEQSIFGDKGNKYEMIGKSIRAVRCRLIPMWYKPSLHP